MKHVLALAIDVIHETSPIFRAKCECKLSTHRNMEIKVVQLSCIFPLHFDVHSDARDDDDDDENDDDKGDDDDDNNVDDANDDNIDDDGGDTDDVDDDDDEDNEEEA